MHGCCSRARVQVQRGPGSLILVLIVGACQPVCAAPPIEGDAALLQVVLDAQAAKRGRFTKGSLIVEVRDRNRMRHFDIAGNVRMVWDGPNTYWNYSLTNRDASGMERESQQDVEMIERADGLFVYTPSLKAAQIIPDKSREYWSVLKLRPEHVWFVVDRLDGVDWLSALSPERVSNATQKFVVRMEGESSVRIERYMEGGARLMALVSLHHDANVVSFEVLPNERAARDGGLFPYVQRGEYDWARDVNGDWYLKSFRSQWHLPGKADDLVQECALAITEFDPNPSIAPDRFSFDSLHVPDRTRIDTIRGGRPILTRRAGRESVRLKTEQLNQLADVARSKGFAAPKPNMP